MPNMYEICYICGEETGKAGKCEDSLYIESDGPFCEECYIARLQKEDFLITINKEILIDSLCEEFGITEGKMRRAIDHAMKIKKENSND